MCLAGFAVKGRFPPRAHTSEKYRGSGIVGVLMAALLCRVDPIRNHDHIMSPNDTPTPQGPDDRPIHPLPPRPVNPWRWLAILAALLLGWFFWWWFSRIHVTYTTTSACRNDGSIDVTATSRKMPLHFQWTSPTIPGFSSTTEDLTGLAPGTYELHVSNGSFFGTTINVVITDTFFTRIGELPYEGILGSVNDLSADGHRLVGNDNADDPLVDSDGDTSGCWHYPQAFGYIRPCLMEEFRTGFVPSPGFPPGNLGRGLVGLGYLTTATTHAESSADGISPDGTVVVGYSTIVSTAICGISHAVVFKGPVVERLAMPDSMHISRAADVSSSCPGAAPVADGPFGAGNRIAVGYASVGDNHPNRTKGGYAVYWDASGGMHVLVRPVELAPGDSVRSAEAVGVADDGSSIAGMLYTGTSPYQARACVWMAAMGGGFAPPILLDDVSGGTDNVVVFGISGDGRTIVGCGTNATDTVAVAWRNDGTAWVPVPEVLPVLQAGMPTFAMAANFDGSVIVGAGSRHYKGQFAAVRWKGGAVEDLAPLLPAGSIPAGWQLQATCVSSDGRTIGGLGYLHDPAEPVDDVYALFIEGWLARLP